MSHIAWTDGIGAASLANAFIAPGSRFANWNPSNRPFGERSQNLGTGALNVTAFRDDLTVSLDITGIPNSSQALMLRLQMHLKRGGSVEINPSDPTIPLFGTCKLAPGADVQIQLSDKTNLEYTFSTVLRGVNALAGLPPGVEVGEFYIWLKGDSVSVSGINPPDETRLAQWKDWAPGANHATQPILIQRPYFDTNIQNGLPAVRFMPPDRPDFDYATRMWLPDVLGPYATNSGEVFVAKKLANDPPSSGLYSGNWNLGGASATYSKYPETDPPLDGHILESCGVDFLRDTGVPPIALDTPHLYNVVSAPGEWTSRINGVTLFTTATNTPAWRNFTTPYPPLLGVSTENSGFYSSECWWFEFLYVTPARTAPQRAAFTSYINTKWAL